MGKLTLLKEAVPGTPAANFIELFVDTADLRLKTKNDVGLVRDFASLGEAQTWAGIQTFLDQTLKLRNPANAFSITLVHPAITADMLLNVPVLTGTDTLAVLGLAQTFTGANTHSGLNALLASSSGLTIRNPANTFSYTITAAAIAAARILNLPLTIATDTLMCLGLAQTVTGILTLTTPVIGVATGTSLQVTGLLQSSGTGAGATGGVGYATGAGGAVTQITSRSTGVTLNTITGTITGIGTSLAAGATATFIVTNSAVALRDVIILSVVSGPTANTSVFFISAVTAGTFSIKIWNLSAVTADTGAPIINFAIIKARNA